MPNIAQIPLISTATTATSFVVVNNRVTTRISYPVLRSQLAIDLSTNENFQGPQGISGYSGIQGYQGYSGASGYSGESGYSGLSGVSGYSGYSGYSGTPGAGFPAGGTTGQALVKSSNNNYETTWTTISGGPGGVGLSNRETITVTTDVLTPLSTATLTLTGFKTYVLLNASTDYPAWVRIYTDGTSRTNDASRSQLTDPIPGSGVIAEIITTSGNLSQKITPGVIGFNNDLSVNTAVYLSVTNNDSVSRAISVSLKLLQLEA